MKYAHRAVIIAALCMLIIPWMPIMAQEEGQSESGSAGFHLNGAMGAAVINGVSYQYFSLRPDIPIGKFGLGLDLSFYFDADGKLREEDWDEGADIIDKIYYLRYGKPNDPVYVRIGSLEPVTLGYGLIMRRYLNAIEWPQVRRIGLHSKVKFGPFGVEAVTNNFRELDTPGLIGGRFTYSMHFIRPVVFGGTFVYDGNQYLGAKDEDGDGIPDREDMFPDKNDGEHISWLTSLLSPSQINSLIASGDLPNINNPPDNISDRDEPVSIYGVDIGVALLDNDRMSIWAYAQAAQIADYGRGYTFPGVMFKMGPFHAGAEYRIFEKEFMSDFFNYSYEVERVVWNEETDTYTTKENQLEGIGSATGIYAEAGANILSLVDFYANYQHMFYDEDIPNKSLFASLQLNTDPIPKIDLAEAYFQQPNADKLFSTDSDGTIIGYKVGAAVGGSMMLVYHNKTIYHNGEPNRIMSVETVIRF